MRRASQLLMKYERLRRLVREDRGRGSLAYIVVAGVFSLLAFQPSLIVASVDRFSNLVNLLISQIGFAF